MIGQLTFTASHEPFILSQQFFLLSVLAGSRRCYRMVLCTFCSHYSDGVWIKKLQKAECLWCHFLELFTERSWNIPEANAIIDLICQANKPSCTSATFLRNSTNMIHTDLKLWKYLRKLKDTLSNLNCKELFDCILSVMLAVNSKCRIRYSSVQKRQINIFSSWCDKVKNNYRQQPPNSGPAAVEQLPRKLFPRPERRGKIPVLIFKPTPEVPVWDFASCVSICHLNCEANDNLKSLAWSHFKFCLPATVLCGFGMRTGVTNRLYSFLHLQYP